MSSYALQANGKVERLVGTFKRSLLRMLAEGPSTWDKEVENVLYGYRHRRQTDGLSPFELMFGCLARMTGIDPVVLIDSPTEEHRQVELLANRVVRASRRTLEISVEESRFAVGDRALVAYRQAMGWAKWLSLQPK